MMMRGPCRSVMVHQSLEFLCLQCAARLVEPTSSDCHGKMSAIVGNANAALAFDHDHASFSAGPFKPLHCALHFPNRPNDFNPHVPRTSPKHPTNAREGPEVDGRR